jgi:hypothetical protein
MLFIEGVVDATGIEPASLWFCKESDAFLSKEWWMLLGSNQRVLGFVKSAMLFIEGVVDATGIEPVTLAL